MSAFIIWYLILEILGLITLPIAFRLFRWLPDRGYALAKPLGLLLTGYGLWVLVSFRFLRNTRIAVVFVVFLVAAGAAYLVAQHQAEFRAFLRHNRRVIVATELLFLVGFAAWTAYRAYNPQLDHTEKPMELAFLNAILRSETFPPHDPWLAGYTISYYYFGYLIAAMLTRLSGVAPAVSFNLMIALLFALALTGAYSLTFNLIEGLRRGIRGNAGELRGTQGNSGESSPRGSVPPSSSEFLRVPPSSSEFLRVPPSSSEFLRVPLSSLLFPLFGPLFVAVVGNLEGFLDVLHSRGLGSAGFWRWLDILEINAPPLPGGWIPVRPTGGWWWWRASRVITQRDLLGHHVEIIDEFPFFSFLLGDMHPHVLALPFAFLALAVALNILFGTGRDEDWLPVPRLTPMALLLPFIVGTFGFLHSWDFPTYLLLIVAAFGLRRYIELGRLMSDWWRDVVWFGLWLGALSIILFLLFHIGPRPYTGGIGLVGVVKTKLRQFMVMFGLFLFVVISLLIPHLRDWWRGIRGDGVTAETWGVLVIAVPVAGLCFVLGWWTAAALAILIGLSAIVLFHKLRLAAFEQRSGGGGEQGSIDSSLSPPGPPAQVGSPVTMSTIFALLLIVTALALTFATEFVFVRDRFGTRMNTVFKLFYQAWVMLAIAAAFGVYYLVRRWRGILRWTWSAGLAVLVLAGLVYPVVAGYTRADRFQREATLNGIAYVEKVRPAEYAAIRWLQANVDDAPTVLEAPGIQYHADTSRISTTTGLPTLVGWGGHEGQWRETVPELAQREADIATIYQSLDTKRVQQLLDQYGVRYVYIGPAETSKYGLTPAQISKFDTFMERVFAQGDVWIFRR
jgi:YYY domain-containing protein